MQLKKCEKRLEAWHRNSVCSSLNRDGGDCFSDIDSHLINENISLLICGGHVFTSGFSGRLASEERKSGENSCFFNLL